jgi:FkbM family methyltransferase
MWHAFLFFVSLALIASLILHCSVLNHLRQLKRPIVDIKNNIFHLHRHFIGENCITSCRGVQFFVPNFLEDILQRTLVATGNFHEIAILEQLDTILPDQAVIFDLGANIGNHSLYWAKKRNARKVYAFEPVRETYKIFKKNIQLNHAEEIIAAHNVAISDCRENLCIKSFSAENIGGTSLQKSALGDIQAIDLDHFQFPEKNIDLIKIDVEGFECNALKGATTFFKNYLPKFVFIEALTHRNRRFVRRFLCPLGYTLRQTFPGYNFLYQLNK